jgi:hypothetical protein
MLRRDQLCPGPGECSYVLMEDPLATADSPRCEDCPLSLLEDYLGSPAGQLIRAAIDLDFALQAGVSISLKEITYAEFLLLRSLTEERNRFHEELMRKPSERPQLPQARRRGYGG